MVSTIVNDNGETAVASNLSKAISFWILEKNRLRVNSLGVEVSTELESWRIVREGFINNKQSMKTHLVLNSLV